jgi:hypothetical protein
VNSNLWKLIMTVFVSKQQEHLVFRLLFWVTIRSKYRVEVGINIHITLSYHPTRDIFVIAKTSCLQPWPIMGPHVADIITNIWLKTVMDEGNLQSSNTTSPNKHRSHCVIRSLQIFIMFWINQNLLAAQFFFSFRVLSIAWCSWTFRYKTCLPI